MRRARSFAPLIPAVLALVVACFARPAGAQRITVEAGPLPRQHAIVEVPWDPSLGSGILTAQDLPPRPLQAVADRAWFVEPDLPAGQRRTYRFRPGQVEARTTTPGDPGHPAVPGPLALSPGGTPVARYWAGPGELPRPDIKPVFLRGGYLHPVFTPSGRVVTDDYPPNHIHHHGLWTAWTRTRFGKTQPDFWNMGEGTGKVDFEDLLRTDSGPVFLGCAASHQHTSLHRAEPGVALREIWVIRAYTPVPGRPFHLLDVELEQSCASDQPLVLPTYHYGGFGYRGPWAWNGASQARYLDSNGVTNRVTAHGTRAKWFWLGGPVNGALAGLAILDHPANFRSPQPLRVHPSEPFVCWAPPQLGEFRIQPGEPYRARYRAIAIDGEPDAAVLERAWLDFAQPVTATRSRRR